MNNGNLIFFLFVSLVIFGGCNGYEDKKQGDLPSLNTDSVSYSKNQKTVLFENNRIKGRYRYSKDGQLSGNSYTYFNLPEKKDTVLKENGQKYEITTLPISSFSYFKDGQSIYKCSYTTYGCFNKDSGNAVYWLDREFRPHFDLERNPYLTVGDSIELNYYILTPTGFNIFVTQYIEGTKKEATMYTLTGDDALLLPIKEKFLFPGNYVLNYTLHIEDPLCGIEVRRENILIKIHVRDDSVET